MRPLLLLLALLTVTARAADPAPAPTSSSALSWPPITATARPWTRWWWMGDAVDAKDIDSELADFKAAGLGGVEITPIYGVKGYDSREIPYLSPAWLDMLNHSIQTASSLGLVTDMALCTGWCFGGPTVSDLDANAVILPTQFDLAPGASITTTFDPATTQALVAFTNDGTSTDLTAKIDATGHVAWTSTSAQHIYSISQKPSPQMVKRAAPGGEGHMLNPFYTQAMTHYFQWFDKAFAATPPRLNATFQDSYEYVSNWSPDLLAQFQKRRGYPLQSYLPALLGSSTDTDLTSRVKSDYRQTISDMMIDDAQPAWVKWSHDHGYLARYQAHGAPANLLDLYSIADIPETELAFKNPNLLVSKFASSAAHIMGHPLASAETATWLAEHFNETLAKLKYCADDMFLGGVNHIIYQGTTYSPDDAAWPGWCFYASTEMNPRNALWHDVLTLNTYIARAQSILQSGTSDNDVLVYWPVYDIWSNPNGMAENLQVGGPWFNNSTFGKTAQYLWDHGYAFDYVSDRQLTSATPADGKLILGGSRYKAIVIPPTTLIPAATLKSLVALANAGIPVIFQDKLPSDIPGLVNLDANRATFKSLIATSGTTTNLIVAPDLGKALATTDVIRESLCDNPGLHFIRRTDEHGLRTYFIANRGAQPFDGWITLPIQGHNIALLDPLNGQTGYAQTRSAASGQLQARLRLDAGESIILRTVDIQALGYQYLPSFAFPDLADPIPLTGTWNIKFLNGGPTLPQPIQTGSLASWTVLGGTDAQAFAGTALYTLTFDAPAGLNTPCDLALNNVTQSARIRLNGVDLGTTIIPPFRVHLTGQLKPKDNLLEIEVTNTSANRIRNLDINKVPWKIFYPPNILSPNYRPLNAATWPIADSGLLGPVTLTPYKN